MSTRSAIRGQKPLALRLARALVLFGLFALSLARGDDFAGLCASRTALEGVYYQHRVGQKPPFEEATPPTLIERLLRQDLHKEALLKKVYGVEITPGLLDAEVQRINTTTRATETLAEIKAALGNDPAKFGKSFAKPFLVERLLRDKFENDDLLHAEQRRECERVRNALLSAKTNGASAAQLLTQLETAESNAVSDITWQLSAAPAETNVPAPDEIDIKRQFGPEAQVLSSPRAGGREWKFYFEDLPGELQRVLNAQLRGAADVSAVIETPGAFLLYLCMAKTETTLAVGCLSLSKRSYEQWLSEQTQIP